MSLNELKINQSAKIMRITAGDELRDRLFSLGLSEGKKLLKINSTLGKNTVAIELERTCVILRSNEAEHIFVELKFFEKYYKFSQNLTKNLFFIKKNKFYAIIKPEFQKRKYNV